MKPQQIAPGLWCLDAERRTYAGLSRDGSYFHLIQPATEIRAKAAEYVDVDGLTVYPFRAGDLVCTCAGGQFHRHCYRLGQVLEHEEAADRERWGVPAEAVPA